MNNVAVCVLPSTHCHIPVTYGTVISDTLYPGSHQCPRRSPLFFIKRNEYNIGAVSGYQPRICSNVSPRDYRLLSRSGCCFYRNRDFNRSGRFAVFADSGRYRRLRCRSGRFCDFSRHPLVCSIGRLHLRSGY